MKILLCENDLQSRVSAGCDSVVRAVSAALEEDGIDGSLNILFTDKEEIQRLNREYRGQDSETDVLSFPQNELIMPLCRYPQPPALERDPETGETVLGDIAICLARAEEQAKEYGHSVLRELCFLAVHGACHLLGYSHSDPRQEREMADKQERILNKLGIHR